MPRAKKKGEAGAAKNYVTRNQAIRKLQLSLQDFRKLCIWKGIYPREPRSRKKANKSATASTTFYYTKDIQYLLHEPILNKFREQKALEKKISRALGRGDFGDAKRLEGNAARPEKTGKTHYTLDHVIRERYPTFIDAIRDLDDCLSMLFLFANLPSTSAVPAKMIARCERLCLEFQHYLITSQSLRKSFLSIKGIYYQANIQGEDVLWLVPYKFKQNLAGDIDFRIMGTFVEFYMTLLGFVNFRLYTGAGLKYPPKFDAAKDDEGAELGAFTLEGRGIENTKQVTNGAAADHQPNPKVQAAVDKLVKELEAAPVEEPTKADTSDEPTDGLDKFEVAAPGGDILPQPDADNDGSGELFSNFTFFLSRETPRQPLEFILRAFGCKRVGWDAVLGGGAFTTNELDPRITHQIVDRPLVQPSADGEDNQTSQRVGPNQRVAGRIYVQPQWVWDSANAEELMRPDLYAPGAAPPPHLSPFVKSVPGRYDPTKPLEEQLPEGHELEMDSDEDGGMDVDGEEDDFESFSADEEEEEEEDAGKAAADEEDDDEEDHAARRREIEAELAGKPLKGATVKPGEKAKADKKKALAKKAKEEEEEIERAKGMLSKKKRKLFEKMQYSNNLKSEEDMRLMAKRRKLEKGKGKGKR
ncbi:probable Pescadillo homolog [Cephalotrichum gorgonifer]|uniref:Pescadillo homolog n=1 Tax=Cephalotrichum gorgonifer TaxID=2041049 RepID=A0AAE8MXP4_9PEZI|nr:probable Pescadillo homolog [Cephalotrichum gorgonifer]